MARKFFTDIDLQNTSRVINIPSPQNSGDAASKAYVDSAVEGLAWKDSCRVATQGNIDLANPGVSIDGVTLTTQDRVLVRAQTTASANGIYVYNGAAVAMTRALDASTFPELEQAITSVEEGTSAGLSYRQTTVNGTLDTTAVTWITFGVATPQASETTSGTAELATQAEVDGGTDDQRIVTPFKLANWSGRIRKTSTNIGDGSATSYTVTHNFNTRDVIVRVFPNSGQYDDVEVDVQRPTINTATLIFATAPAANAYRVVVIG